MRKTPSAPAMRAATEILGHPYLGSLTVTRGGELIDAATGLPELIAALEAMDEELRLLAAQGLARQKPSLQVIEMMRRALAASAPTPGRDG